MVQTNGNYRFRNVTGIIIEKLRVALMRDGCQVTSKAHNTVMKMTILKFEPTGGKKKEHALGGRKAAPF
jgi:hypothetical protein